MQPAQNELREVIWEITDICNQNCTYCGSKDILNQTQVDENKILGYASEICSMPTLKEVNISGGNPLLVPLTTHKKIIDMFQAHGIKSKIIVNPFNIVTDDSEFEILDLYDWVGLSVNTKKELEQSKYLYDKPTNVTVITNFNQLNIFLFNEIAELVKQWNCSWQIQYSMFQEHDDDLAIYNNIIAKNMLKSLILKNRSLKIIQADNMNRGECSAGKYSIGILANGIVVPCLSMRSWTKEINATGRDLNKFSLEEIWTHGFAKFRCEPFKCCKDVTHPNDEKMFTDIPEDLQTIKYEPIIPIKTEKTWPVPNNIFVYGVISS